VANQLEKKQRSEMESVGVESEQMEYKFADLYNNNSAIGLTFMITGDKFIETYRLSDPKIRNNGDFVCELWGFGGSTGLRHRNDVINILTFINRETEQVLRISNMDGKLYTHDFVGDSYSEMYIEIPDQFNIFLQY
jgi:hypothetical protein